MPRTSQLATLAVSCLLAGGLVYWFLQRRREESVRAVFGDASALNSPDELPPRLSTVLDPFAAWR